jgi:N,N'-diacetyllegionaminate synthase
METGINYLSSNNFKSIYKIGSRYLGEGYPCFIIAEAGVSHFGDISKAFKLIEAAVDAGVDAVKFQIFKTEEMISVESTEWIARMKPKELPLSSFIKIRDYCKDKGIIFFATAHDPKSFEELMQLDPPCIKIGSGEVQNYEFYRLAASCRKPIILSTGMFLKDDVIQVLKVLAESGCTEVALMHCITEYPTPPSDINLRMIQTLKSLFPGPVGYSDHAATYDIAAASVLMGANLIEKHITLEKNIPDAQDWKVSCTPGELVEFVSSVRRLEAAIGKGEFNLTDGEKRSLLWARKSIVAARDINAGEVINKDDLAFKRPGTGISPADVKSVAGKRALKFIKKDHLIMEDMIGEE